MTIVPADPATLVQKFASGTAFQADAAKADITAAASQVGSISSFMFDPSDPTMQTLSAELQAELAAEDIANVRQLGTGIAQANSALSAMGSHINTQLSNLPQNLNVFSSHSNLVSPTPDSTQCQSKLSQFFGSLLGSAKKLMQDIGSIFTDIGSVINGFIVNLGNQLAGILAFVRTSLNTILTGVIGLINQAVSAVTGFIAAETAILAQAVRDLITHATAGLFPSLFKDDCIKQAISVVGNGITKVV